MRGLRRRLLGTLRGVETDRPLVSLTFDDGPDPRWTPGLLSILARHEARATFFMIGSRAAAQPDLVRRVAESGHAIGNHSWTHPSFPLLSRRERFRQIRKCADALSPYASRLFRPPRGDMTGRARLDIALAGYRVVTWNVVVPDWVAIDPDDLATALAEKVRAGSIVLLHDGLYDALDPRYFDRGSTLAAVELLLERLGATFDFVTVPELLAAGRPITSYWSQEPDHELLERLEVEERMGSGR